MNKDTQKAQSVEEIKVGQCWTDVIHVQVKILEINNDYQEIRYWCEKIGRGSKCWRTAKELSVLLPFGI